MSSGIRAQVSPGSAGSLLFNWQDPSRANGGGGCGGGCSTTSMEGSGVCTFISQAEPDPRQMSRPAYPDLSDAYVRIEFSGDNGATQTAELDLGCEASFPASALSAACVYPLVSKVAPVQQPNIVVNASVGRGRGGHQPPTRTIQVTSLLELVTTTPWIVIPTFAVDVTQIRLSPELDAPVNFWLEWSRYALDEGIVGESTLSSELFVPVPRLARYFRVTNMIPLSEMPGTSGNFGAVQFRLQL